jgi:serine/threonine protein kinase
VLTDFGLSKYFDRAMPRSSTGPGDITFTHSAGDASASAGSKKRKNRSSLPAATTSSGVTGLETTTTFCGTAEYLAPEVLLGDKVRVSDLSFEFRAAEPAHSILTKSTGGPTAPCCAYAIYISDRKLTPRTAMKCYMAWCDQQLWLVCPYVSQRRTDTLLGREPR